MAKGSLNSWKVRYFRQEGTELVYYESKPADGDMAENHITQKHKPETIAAAEDTARKLGISVEAALVLETEKNAAIAAETIEDNQVDGELKMADEEAAKLAEAIPDEVFDDKNLKGYSYSFIHLLMTRYFHK